MSSGQRGSAVGILSMGDMGSGIARLLVAKGLEVVTNCKGRSEDTARRACEAGVRVLDSDEALVNESAVILSVVPPRDAVATAQRIIDALPPPPGTEASSGSSKEAGEEASEPLFYVDLNAVSPATAEHVDSLFARSNARHRGTGLAVTFVDGCILGGPPRAPNEPDANTNVAVSSATGGQGGASSSSSSSSSAPHWSVPGIPTSGPKPLSSAPRIGALLSATLRESYISPSIGSASGLKMCFASVSKGFTALAVESVTTAHRLGVLPLLLSELRDRLPAHATLVERSVPLMPPKAYRWVREMEEISDTHRDAGGFADEAIFRGAAAVYRTVADDTPLGAEKIGKRKRGQTVEDVAAAVVEGMERKRKKTD